MLLHKYSKAGEKENWIDWKRGANLLNNRKDEME
jgi:hypothetical protein